MKLLDIFLLILLVWGGYNGFRKGLILEIFSIGALVLAVLGSVRLLEKAVGLVPDNPLFHYHLGVAYFRSGNRSRAEVELTSALLLSEEFPGVEHARELLKRMAG